MPHCDSGSGTAILDTHALEDFLARSRPGLVTAELRSELISGGRSNLTYGVTDGEHRWILRRPPLGHVLATAHDMAREYRVITALGPSPVPVPKTLVLCEEPSVIGAPFYVMERADGTPYRFASELEALGRERTRAIAERLVDTLATLHAVDPNKVGLEDFGRPDGFLARQVRRWGQQMDASRSRPLPLAEELLGLLQAAPVPKSQVGIVHGDYRLDNLLVDHADRVTAVLDWEMSTLGDPLTDLAMLCVYLDLDRLDPSRIPEASSSPGFLRPEEIVDRYGLRSGRGIGSMSFYLALAHFKLAAILEGIHYRYVHGQTVGPGFDAVGALVEPLLRAGINHIRGDN
jgi:aminoglycoside phosphotransferase (APT) family kinase protein